MKKIYLFCSAGMSTNMLVNKMKQEAKKQDIQIDISAFSESLLSEKAPEADIILLGPQIRYLHDEVSEKFTNKIVEVIDPAAYAKLDGLGVLNHALNRISNN